MHTNFQVEKYEGNDWIGMFFVVITAVIVALMLVDVIFGAVKVTEWIGAVVYKIIY